MLGVSKDSLDKLRKFAQRDHLTFPLLSDPDLTVHKLYGAYGEKKLYGRTHIGVIRSTFVISVSVTGAAGTIETRPLQRPGEGSCGFFDEGSAIGALRTRRHSD